MSAISILILIEKWWFSALGVALRRDCGEAVAWDRGVKPFLQCKIAAVLLAGISGTPH